MAAGLLCSVVGPWDSACGNGVGAAIVNALLAETVVRLHAAGIEAPIYFSANLPGPGANDAAPVARDPAPNPQLQLGTAAFRIHRRRQVDDRILVEETRGHQLEAANDARLHGMILRPRQVVQPEAVP